MEAALLHLVIVLLVVGVALWAINRFVPMQPNIKQILNVAIVIACVIYVLVILFGLSGVRFR